MSSEVKMEDIVEILNRISDALEGTEYIVTGFDNSGRYLEVIIDKKWI